MKMIIIALLINYPKFAKIEMSNRGLMKFAINH